MKCPSCKNEGEHIVREQYYCHYCLWVFVGSHVVGFASNNGQEWPRDENGGAIRSKWHRDRVAKYRRDE